MTSTQIRERIAKAEEKMTKKQGTITKKQALIAKKQAQIEKMKANGADERDVYWEECDVRHLNEDIRRLEKEIPEIRKTVEKYEKQLAGEIERESILTKEMPEVFTSLKDHLVEVWDEYDKKRKAFLKERYEELGYREFYQYHNGADYALMHTSDADIHKTNVKSAENIIVDLFNRVKEITGEVIAWDVHVATGNQNLAVLEGTVQGKEGKASVETVEAGGWNIQKLHIRTLVHSI